MIVDLKEENIFKENLEYEGEYNIYLIKNRMEKDMMKMVIFYMN